MPPRCGPAVVPNVSGEACSYRPMYKYTDARFSFSTLDYGLSSEAFEEGESAGYLRRTEKIGAAELVRTLSSGGRAG